MVFGKQINRYYGKYIFPLLIGVFALVLVDYFQLKIPELYALVIDGINYGEVTIDDVLYVFDTQLLWEQVCVPMFIIIAALVSGRFLWRICLFGTGYKVERDLRGRMFNHAKDLSCEFYSVNKVGNMMSLFTNDLETIQDCFGSGILTAFDAFFMGGLSLFKMFNMNWIMTLLSLIPMALMLVVGIVVGRYMTAKWDARQKAFSDLADFAQESFSGIAVIKAFVKEFKELWAFKRLNKQNEDANVAYTKMSMLLHVLVSLFVESVICIVLGYGSYLVYNHTFTAGQLMEFIGYFNAIVWPVMAITELIDMSSRGKASVKRVTEFLDAKPDVVDKPTAQDADAVAGNITFNHLTFRYPSADYDALQDVTFDITAGQSVGIVGKTGCGKTTLADLILRCYNVEDGSILIDGKDVNDITIKSLRSFCAYVPQDNFLFSDTIENNISFAENDVDGDTVQHAAVMADIHDNIQGFPNGYKTVLGERGVTVSGGQKQRISIARALLKNSSILIMDDSVSAVDTDTERKILGNLKAERQGKTTILIAHRISTVQNLDKVVYMDNGKIVDVGTHDELLSRCADYQNMVALQKLEDEEGM
ncbi:MAG: ABC transporter ATP-binding protein/permease [Clostridia bacterium]|nr:ABC transporter ATP-binding protein/permease [Clostridia bacterium]